MIQAIQGDYTRRNFFRLLEQETRHDITWVSYWNRATFSGEQVNREQLWLESAVLVREDGHWRIRMLHSTRVASEDIPAGLELEEHPHD